VQSKFQYLELFRCGLLTSVMDGQTLW